jgi:hypothetical protein
MAADDEQVLEVVPGRSLGPFAIGMTEETLPADFEYEVRPGAAGLPDWLVVKDLPVKLYLETSPKPGADEIEVAAGLGVGARLGSVELVRGGTSCSATAMRSAWRGRMGALSPTAPIPGRSRLAASTPRRPRS